MADAIKDRNNTFSSNETYYYSMVENYITQYNSKSEEYVNQITELTKVRDEVAKQIVDAESTIDSETAITEKAKVTIGVASGALEVEQQILVSTDELDPDNAEIILAAQATISTQQDIISQETSKVQTANSKIEVAQALKEAQKKIVEDKNEAIVLLQNSRTTALSGFENETVTSMEAQILTFQKTLLSYQDNKNESENKKSVLTQDSVETNITNVQNTEMNTILADISSYNNKKTEIETNRNSVQASIERMTVYASISGIINTYTEVVEGNYLASGTSVLTIIPQDDNKSYIVKAYISNQDIAKISPGMQVKYEIAAYPSSEYGTMAGKLLSVSEDVKVNDDSGSAYYVAVISVDTDTLYNSKGKKATMKVGMLCEAKIVVEQKKVLYYLLEKIDMLD